MDISLNDVTGKLAGWLIASPEGQSARDRKLLVDQKSYEIQIIAFNIASVALVLTVTLAFFTAISMYAAFVLAVPLYFLRHALVESLNQPSNLQRLSLQGEWKRDSLTIFGHVLWKSLLPEPAIAAQG